MECELDKCVWERKLEIGYWTWLLLVVEVVGILHM